MTHPMCQYLVWQRASETIDLPLDVHFGET